MAFQTMDLTKLKRLALSEDYGWEISSTGNPFCVELEAQILQVSHPDGWKLEKELSKNMGVTQILELSENSFKIHTRDFNSILEKVGDLPVVIISINGSSREGKSYVLNYFIRYFKAQGSENWFQEPLLPHQMFSSRSGRERETVGMNLYSEPFKYQRENGKEVAVLLLDCQGLFDDKTTFKQNAVIFALSNLFSSSLIYNVKSKIQENLLQNIQFFSNYAQAIVDEQEANDLLPPLTFLIRDFAFDYEYPLGYHSSEEQPEDSLSKNYFLASLSVLEDMPLENQIVRKEILRKFQQLRMFLMPFPGKEFLMDSSKNEPDEDFQYYLQQFVTTMTSEPFLTPKMFNGVELTGRDLQTKVEQWALLCEESASKFPEAQTLAESHCIMQNEMALSNAIHIFTERFDQVFAASSCGFSQAELASYFETFRREGAQNYQDVRRFEKPEILQCFLEKFQESCQELFENHYMSKNNAIAARLQLQYQMDEGEQCNEKILQTLREKISTLQSFQPLLDEKDSVAENAAPPSTPPVKKGVPLKPIRKAPPPPHKTLQTEDFTARNSFTKESTQMQAPSTAFPSLHQECSPRNVSSASQFHDCDVTLGKEAGRSNAAYQARKNEKSALKNVKNFFSRFFVEGPRDISRKFQQLIFSNKKAIIMKS